MKYIATQLHSCLFRKFWNIQEICHGGNPTTKNSTNLNLNKSNHAQHHIVLMLFQPKSSCKINELLHPTSDWKL